MIDFDRASAWSIKGWSKWRHSPYAWPDPDDSFVILDEAQNTTSEQMKMFLTRLDLAQKRYYGDVSRSTSPDKNRAGGSRKNFKDIEGIRFVHFQK